jgi:1,4-dihydroxy-2-naphthoate octaprenyltransferase
VNKRTMIVAFGIPPCILVYRATLAASYVAATAMLLHRATFFGGLLYLLTLPLCIFAMRAANAEDLTTPGLYRANQLTILLHNIGSIALAAGLLLPGLVS